MKKIDTRGLSCPEPVLRVRGELKNLVAGDSFHVLVDTVTARENVSRAARAAGCDVELEASGNDFVLQIRKTP